MAIQSSSVSRLLVGCKVMNKIAWLHLVCSRAAAFNPSFPETPHRMGSRTRQGWLSSSCGHPAVVMDTPTPTDEFEKLSTSLELAVRTERYEDAARLRDELAAAEAANPVEAVRWRQLKQVRKTRDEAYFPGQSIGSRLEAVQSLKNMAFPPAASGAEDALHEILVDVSGEDAGAVRQAIDEALWEVWYQSGDDDIDAAMQNGVELMNGQRWKEAANEFTKIIEMEPTFAEGWNKRATVYYLMGNVNQSIEDCLEVLKLKPRHFGCLAGLGMCYEKRGKLDEALKYNQAALDVHPGLQNVRLSLSQLCVKVQQEPRVENIVKALEKRKDFIIDLSEEVSVDWDVHRLSGTSDYFQYFVRVKYKNKGSQTRPVRIVSRCYVLQFVNGKVFPFARVLEEGSPAKFSLSPGEEYQFCWQLIVSKKVKGMTGTTLFEVLDESSKARRDFTNVGFDFLDADEGPEVDPNEQDKLQDGHEYYGYLDLRGLDFD